MLSTFGQDGGGFPTGRLIQGTDGNMYGTAQNGGDYDLGTVFESTSTGTLTILHSFAGFPSDGATPYGGLAQHTNGKFYGVTSVGGSFAPGYGTVFELDNGFPSFVAFIRPYARATQSVGILGQGFTGTTSVSLSGTPMTFTVVSDTFIRATVPAGATTGYVMVATPSGTLQSNVPFRVIS